MKKYKIEEIKKEIKELEDFDFKEELRKRNIKLIDFTDYWLISYSTARDWKRKRRRTPTWILKAIEMTNLTKIICFKCKEEFWIKKDKEYTNISCPFCKNKIVKENKKVKFINNIKSKE